MSTQTLAAGATGNFAVRGPDRRLMDQVLRAVDEMLRHESTTPALSASLSNAATCAID